MSDHLTANQISAYTQRTLSCGELAGVMEHVESCEVCRVQIRSSLLPLGRKPNLHLPYEQLVKCLDAMESLDHEALAHYRQCQACQQDIGELRTARASIPDASSSRWWDEVRRWLGRPVTLAAIAASCVLLVWIGRSPRTVSEVAELETMRIPATLEALRPRTSILLGEPSVQEELRVIEPLATLTPQRPTFRWAGCAGAAQVEVYDQNFRQVTASGPVNGSEWTGPEFPRSTLLTWTVRCGDALAPKPPAIEGRFQVIAESDEQVWQQARQRLAGDPVRLGIAAANLGLRQEALRLMGTDPRVAEYRKQLSW